MRTIFLLLLVVISSPHAWAQDGTALAPPATAPAETKPCDEQGLATLFTCTWQDVSHLGHGRSLNWLLAGSGLAAASVLLDDEISNSLMDADPDTSFAAGGPLGEAGLHFGLPAALYLGARATGHPEAAKFAVTMLRTQVVNGILTRSLKMVPRARPNQLEVTPAKGSFPSGHTSAAFATATVIQRRWGWKGGVPAYFVAGYIGASRLQNLHYLSDVTFGAALGIASGLVVKMPSRRLSVSPMIAAGVTGITVTLRDDSSSVD